MKKYSNYIINQRNGIQEVRERKDRKTKGVWYWNEILKFGMNYMHLWQSGKKKGEQEGKYE